MPSSVKLAKLIIAILPSSVKLVKLIIAILIKYGSKFTYTESFNTENETHFSFSSMLSACWGITYVYMSITING